VSEPHYGRTRTGLAVHARSFDHLLGSGSRAARFNARAAVIITTAVGTMWCAYVFGLFDLISLPAAIRGGSATIVSWVAQTFLQLVLLSIIMVGQQVQAQASDARAAKTFEDTEVITDRLDTRTQGGITDVLDAVQKVSDDLAGLAQAIRVTHSGETGERLAGKDGT
jgi:hypothetical protein